MYHVFPLRLLMSAKGLRFMSLHREPCAAIALFCRENIRSAGLVNLVWEARQLRHEFLQSGFGQPTRRNLGSNTQRSSDSLGNARTLPVLTARQTASYRSPVPMVLEISRADL